MLDVVKYLMERLKDKRDSHVVVAGIPFALRADGTIGEQIKPPAPDLPEPLHCATLEGLIEAYRAQVDGVDAEKSVFHIQDHLCVSLCERQADTFGRRKEFAVARHRVETPFQFDCYMIPEKFRIDFQASFYLNEDAVKVLRLVSQLGTKGEEVNISDDGISQTVELKAGTVTRGKVDLPSEGIPLVPWRTFRDVPPVTSKFLLRLKSDGGPKVALHEIDAKWQLDTVAAIREYIRKHEPKAFIVG